MRQARKRRSVSGSSQHAYHGPIFRARPRPANLLNLPDNRYDVVGSIVLFKTPEMEVAAAIDQFLAVPLRTHLCVVDNSPEPSVHRVDPKRVTYWWAGANLGYGRAHNLAIRAALGRTRYNLVMNTDVAYHPDAVLQLHEYLEQNPQAGLAAPQIRNPDGTMQYVCRLLPTPINLFLRRFLPDSAWTRRADESYELRRWDHSTRENLPYFQGSFLMLRTDLANRIGGFDERFFMYGEDIDLCRRIHEEAEAMYIPEAKVTHEYRRYSSRSLRGTWIGIQNNVRYFNKWGWFFDRRRREVNRLIKTKLLDQRTALDSGP
jgi:GT2 family glycosyltransferase